LVIFLLLVQIITIWYLEQLTLKYLIGYLSEHENIQHIPNGHWASSTGSPN
jgi:hypothetical protein